MTLRATLRAILVYLMILKKEADRAVNDF